MLRSHLRHALIGVRNIALGVLAFFAVQALYTHMEGLIVSDPFQKLREEEQSGLANTVGVQLDDVHVNAYRNGKLVTSAMADRIDLNRQDRELFTLNGIHDGVFTEGKRQYHYSANQAIWQGLGRQLNMTGMVRVYNADLDLRTDSVQFNDVIHSLVTPEPITGRFLHGSLRATGFKMNTQTEGYSTGPVQYSGDLAMLQQKDDSDQIATHQWHLSGDLGKFVPSKNGSRAVKYYVNGYGRDDEMILKADLVAQYDDDDTVVATGNVRYFSAKADISADRATIYRREKKVVLVGHVVIYIKPKSDGDKPPVEEPLPPYKRIAPEEMVAAPPPGAESTTPKTLNTSKPGQGSAPPASKPTGTPPPPASTATTTSPPTPQSTIVTPQTPQVPPTSTVPQSTTQSSRPPAPTTTTKTPPKTPPGAPGGAKSKTETEEQKRQDEELRNGKTIRKYPMIIVCDEIDYWYRKGDRHGHILGNPQGRQDLPGARWRYVWSASSDYNGETDQLTLFSSAGKNDVRMKNSKGDDVTALELTVSTKDDEEAEAYSGKKMQDVSWIDNTDDDAADKTKKPTKSKN